VAVGRAKLDASAFRGRESDQHRWNLERPRLDSFALRAAFNPSARWSLQASAGKVAEPEPLHPGLDVTRFTVSAARSAPLGPARLETLLALGRNRRSQLLSTSPFPSYPPRRTQDAVLLESALRWPAGHALLARLEWVEKDELFVRRDAFHVRTFPVAKLDVGAVREVAAWRRFSGGVGFTAGVHHLPEILEGDYGRRPWAYTLFGRVRLR
jgi:hypothetical protein